MRIVIKEAGVEYAKEDAPTIIGPAQAAEACKEVHGSDTEMFCVLHLDARNRLILAEIVTMGTANATAVHARETFRRAIMLNANAVILVHNHPTGNTTPSQPDIEMTMKLVLAGKILDIRLIDHIVVGRNGITSMREEKILEF